MEGFWTTKTRLQQAVPASAIDYGRGDARCKGSDCAGCEGRGAKFDGSKLTGFSQEATGRSGTRCAR